MKQREHVWVNIDVDKFKLLLKGYPNYGAFGETIGRSNSWVGESISRGKMKKADYIAVKATHGIDLEAPKPIVEEPKDETKEVAPFELTDEVKEALCDIVYRGMVKALNEVFNN